LQQSCFRYPSPAQAWIDNLWLSRAFAKHKKFGDYRFWGHDEAREVDWVSGACFMLRREVFERTGGFDQKFFMYAEEADWQRRIRDAGWEIAFTPDAVVTHFGGASGGKDRSRMDRYFFGSLDYYQLKHHGLIGLILLRLAMVVGCSMRTALWLAVMLVSPARRADARGKLRLHSWLVWRQLTHWRVADALRP
jgi:GT2 family glycosyltransferase